MNVNGKYQEFNKHGLEIAPKMTLTMMSACLTGWSLCTNILLLSTLTRCLIDKIMQNRCSVKYICSASSFVSDMTCVIIHGYSTAWLIGYGNELMPYRWTLSFKINLVKLDYYLSTKIIWASYLLLCFYSWVNICEVRLQHTQKGRWDNSLLTNIGPGQTLHCITQPGYGYSNDCKICGILTLLSLPNIALIMCFMVWGYNWYSYENV